MFETSACVSWGREVWLLRIGAAAADGCAASHRRPAATTSLRSRQTSVQAAGDEMNSRDHRYKTRSSPLGPNRFGLIFVGA